MKCVRKIYLPGGGQVKCGFPVAHGGDRHAAGMCPVRGRRGVHDSVKRRRRRAGQALPQRGAPVAGTGKPSASSDKRAAPKKV